MSVKIITKGHLEYCYLRIRLDFEEPANPDFSVVQFKQVILQAVKSLFGTMSLSETLLKKPSWCSGKASSSRRNKTGASNQIDILKFTRTDRTAAIRVHHRFLAQFWAALTLYSEHDGKSCAFRVLQVSSHLMALAANSRLTPIRIDTE